MAVDLVFKGLLDTGRPVDLVFGADTAPPTSDQQASFSVVLSMPNTAFLGSYATNADRKMGNGCSAGWQQGTQAPSQQTAARWLQAASVSSTTGAAWDEGAPATLARVVESRQSAAVTVERTAVYREATPAARSLRAQHQDCGRMRAARTFRHQDGRPAHRARTAAWEERTPLNNRRLQAAWQEGTPLTAARRVRQQAGTSLRQERRAPWQEGRRAPPGRYLPPPVLPVVPVDRCYTPPAADEADFLFSTTWFPSTALLFRCRDFDLPATYTIPFKKTYMAVHTVSVVRLPDLLPLPALTGNISTDADSWCWSLSATGPASLMDLLAPTAGAPAQLRVTVDGIAWEFIAESLSRTREFGKARVALKGRSVTAALSDPYATPTTWTNAAESLAGQIATGVLADTGVTLDWGVDDWLVPAGAWSHQGTPISALSRIAEAAGASLSSPRAGSELRVKPHYSLLPWEWNGAAVAPDVQLPLAVVIRDGFERRDRPAYNRAVVSGENQGVLGLITRGGTAGDLSAPMVTDALATAQNAVRQRGAAILGSAGPQALVSLSLPLLTGGTMPGVLDVGQLVEVVEPTETWRGMVRAVDLSINWPTIRQSVSVERHL